jgi:hypothetical protein
MLIALHAFAWGCAQVHDHFLPIMVRCLVNSPQAIKIAAAEGVVTFFRSMKREKHRTDVYSKLVRDFALGKSCYHRLVFVDLCLNILKRFSTKFFKVSAPGSSAAQRPKGRCHPATALVQQTHQMLCYA